MRSEKAFLNGVLIGEASTWVEVRALLKSKNIVLVGKAGMAEGPTGFFYVSRGLVKLGGQRSCAADQTG